MSLLWTTKNLNQTKSIQFIFNLNLNKQLRSSSTAAQQIQLLQGVLRDLSGDGRQALLAPRRGDGQGVALLIFAFLGEAVQRETVKRRYKPKEAGWLNIWTSYILTLHAVWGLRPLAVRHLHCETNSTPHLSATAMYIRMEILWNVKKRSLLNEFKHVLYHVDICARSYLSNLNSWGPRLSDGNLAALSVQH